MTDDQFITMGDGSRSRAVDLPELFEAMTWTEDDGWCVRRARKWANKTQDVVCVQTESGRIVRVSNEHPFWTADGWVAAAKLIPGVAVGVSRGMPCGASSVDLDRAFLLGAIIGDGGLTSKSRVLITIGAPEMVDAVAESVARIGWRFIPRKGSKYTYSLSGYGRPGGPVGWIRGLGLEGTGSHTKLVPNEVSRWSAPCLAHFIAGYLEADGTVTDGKSGRSVELYSVSRDLLDGFQSILLRLGVVSRLARKRGRYKGDVHLSWRLAVCGSSIDQLASVLPGRCLKTIKLKTICNRVANDSFDLIPDGLIDRFMATRYIRPGLGPRIDTRRPRGHQR